MTHRARIALALTLTAAAALFAAGCGERHESTKLAHTQRLRLMLDYLPNADHVGIYQAAADGAFARAGLSVKIEVPANPAAPLSLVAAGRVDLAISYEPELLLARDRGLNLVSIGAIVQRPLTSIIALRSKNIKTAADLTGKTIGTAGIDYQTAELRTILQAAKINPSTVKQVGVGFDLVKAMLTNKVDATLGGFWNYEAIQLRQMKRNPIVIPVDQAGVPTYDELVLVARGEELTQRPQLIRAFLQALGRGYASVRTNPSAGVNALLKANPSLDRNLQTASVKATLPAFFPANPARPFGYQNVAQWTAFGAWMRNHGLLKHPPAIARAVTNELLPGQGE